jgi:phytoene dehydrogenase-like protein
MRTATVGGGIGGLITALLLSKRGFSVDIFEKENKLGGRLAFVEKDGYKIDEGPTIVLLPLMLERILEEAGISASQYELIRCDPLYVIHFPDGTTYTKKANEKDQLEEISRLFPGEEQNYRRFMTELKKRFELGSKAFLEKTFVNKRDFWTWQNIKALKKMNANKSIRKFVSTYFHDERLVDAYSLQSLYIGGNPYSAPSIIDPSLAPEGKSVLYALVPVPSGGHIDWSNQQDFVDRVIRTLEEKGFEELRKEIEWVKVRTPNDAQAFGLYEGGSFGIAPELFQSGVFRPQYKPYEYKNVFAVGASIHPGGGVPIVMQGAKMLADHLIEQSSIQTVAKLS